MHCKCSTPPKERLQSCFAALFLVLCFSCSAYAQSNAQTSAQTDPANPQDALVLIYHRGDTWDSLQTGVIYHSDDGEAFIYSFQDEVRRWTKEDSLVPGTKRKVSTIKHEWYVIANSGSGKLNCVAAKLKATSLETGKGLILVAESTKLPSHAKPVTKENVKDAVSLKTVSVKKYLFQIRKNGQWRINQLVSNEKVVKHPTDRGVAIEIKPGKTGYVFGAGTFLGFLQRNFDRSRMDRLRVVNGKYSNFLGDFKTFIDRGTRVQATAYDSMTVEVQCATFTTAVSEPVKSVKLNYVVTDRDRKSFSKEPLPKGSTEVVCQLTAKENWIQPEFSKSKKEDAFPYASMWSTKLKIPFEYGSRKPFSFYVHYQFVLETESGERFLSVNARKIGPFLDSPNPFESMNFHEPKAFPDLPLLLTGSATLAHKSELVSPAESKLIKVTDVPRIVDVGKKGVFKCTSLSIENSNIVHPIACNEDESRVAIASNSGQLFVGEFPAFKFGSSAIEFTDGIENVAWWRGRLFVLLRDLSRIVEVDPDSLNVVREIGLPKLFRRPKKSLSYAAQMLFHPKSETAFVCHLDATVSINLGESKAEQWFKPGGAHDGRSTIKIGSRSPCRFQFTPDGQALLKCSSEGLYLIRGNGSGFELENLHRSQSGSCSMAVDESLNSAYWVRDGELDGNWSTIISKVSLDDFQNSTDVVVGTNLRDPDFQNLLFDPAAKVLFSYRKAQYEEKISVLDLNGNEVASIRPLSESGDRIFGDGLLLLPKSRRLVSWGIEDSNLLSFIYEIPQGLADGSAAASVYPAPKTTDLSWAGETRETDAGTVTSLTPEFEDIRWPITWAPGSQFIYITTQAGKILKVSTDDWRAVAELDVQTRTGTIGVAKCGLLAPVADQDLVLLLDEDLNVRKGFPVDQPFYIASSETQNHFFVGSYDHKEHVVMQSIYDEADITKLYLIDAEDGVKWNCKTGMLGKYLYDGKESFDSIDSIWLSRDGKKLVTCDRTMTVFDVLDDGIKARWSEKLGISHPRFPYTIDKGWIGVDTSGYSLDDDRDGSSHTLYKIDGRTPESRKLEIPTDGRVSSTAYSPARKQFFFCVRRDLLITDRNGKSVHELKGIGYGVVVSVSPDGKKALFLNGKKLSAIQLKDD